MALRIPTRSGDNNETNNNSHTSCFELAVDDAGVWHLTRPHLTLAPETRYFAPANLRAAAEDDAYRALVAEYVARGYTLRYCGGLVPDVAHMLVMAQGVYVSPVTAKSKAKLRRLYEVCPLALVVECAGGRAVDPVDGRGVLEREVTGCGERGGLVCGSAGAVEEAVGRLLARE